jgi:BASS family bile acid:Na+ symporter
MMKPELIIRIFTIGSLAGLLLAVGLRLTFTEVLESIRRCRFGLILAVNFVAVPLAFAAAAKWAGLGRDTTIAMVLLGSAPFAPVVPVFARMARADLALAAGLTSIYPVISAVLTPWVCGLLLGLATGAGELHFASGAVMFVLLATITLPLVLGLGLKQVAPRFSQRWLRTVEVISEAAGAFSLCFVTIVEFRSIVAMNGKGLLVVAVLFELCLAAGYGLGHEQGSRRVVALGTSNRNIALALLIGLESFPNLHVVSAIVGNGLLLILLGLVHVGYWNLRDRRPEGRTS